MHGTRVVRHDKITSGEASRHLLERRLSPQVPHVGVLVDTGHHRCRDPGVGRTTEYEGPKAIVREPRRQLREPLGRPSSGRRLGGRDQTYERRGRARN